MHVLSGAIEIAQTLFEKNVVPVMALDVSHQNYKKALFNDAVYSWCWIERHLH